jgi:hypothetical protein
MAHVHETHTESGSGAATGMLVGIVLVVLVLAVTAFVFFGSNLRLGAQPQQPNAPSIQVPSTIDVNVKQSQP